MGLYDFNNSNAFYSIGSRSSSPSHIHSSIRIPPVSSGYAIQYKVSRDPCLGDYSDNSPRIRLPVGILE